ncbi:two-component regulator propeller domain-containing protein [Flavobacterium chuncheonense]|uniref:Two-component regulator propeller domain-containing protein n=1 Tax=Flavobacterium chuncheonense TaxID=2026653 RepID=A0ABW5YM39_9FLAO
MKFKIFYLLLLIGNFLFGQENQLWKGYFSYNQIVDLDESVDAIYAGTDNSVFYKKLNDQDVSIYNSVNGLKPESITCVLHSDFLDKVLVGNDNGLLLVVNSDGSIAQKVDIIEEVPVPASKKKINDLYEYDGKVYVATNYGISVFDLSSLEFTITYFISPTGSETEVLQTTVLNNDIYAVTREHGIRKASLSNPFLYDYNQWQTFDAGYWNGIVTFNDELVAMNVDGYTYRYNISGFVQILNQNQLGLRLKTNGNQVVITTSNHVYVLNQQYIQEAHITAIPDYNVVFSAATVVGSILYIGTEKNGLFSTSLLNPTVFENMSPNGPIQNYTFRVKKAPNTLWVVHGDYSRLYNPYPLDEIGVSKYYNDKGWVNIPYEDLLEAKSLSDIAINPNNADEVYITSYFSGLLKFQGDNITLFNSQNTGPNGLETLVLSPPDPNYIDVRINSPSFDKQGNLWVTNSRVNRALKVLRTDGQWQSYNFQGIAPSVASGRYAPMAIDKNNTKWIPAINDGLIAFNDVMNNKFIVINSENGNLPDPDVRCVAIDSRNQLWIGTFKGLRVLPSVDRFLTDNQLSTNAIIIQEGDLAQELFYQQTILDIAVDGANRKWISIADGGVFLVSQNGQQTIYRFDKTNSPLPSNNVVDIEIDGATGEVFFATDKGLVSFLGIATKPSDNLANVFVYPNPVRPEFIGTVKIAGLTDQANVKITDIEGNLVYETTSAGGTIEWDTTAFGKHKVASGVYMVFVATDDGSDTTVKKVMIIR